MLSRRPSESIVIGDNEVIIEVVEIAQDFVRLGFTAPRETAINRAEVYARKKAAGAKLYENGQERKDVKPV